MRRAGVNSPNHGAKLVDSGNHQITYESSLNFQWGEGDALRTRIPPARAIHAAVRHTSGNQTDST